MCLYASEGALLLVMQWAAPLLLYLIRTPPVCAAAAAVTIITEQQPIGDFDAQRKRLNLIRSNLTGWRALGCELIECYQ